METAGYSPASHNIIIILYYAHKHSTDFLRSQSFFEKYNFQVPIHNVLLWTNSCKNAKKFHKSTQCLTSPPLAHHYYCLSICYRMFSVTWLDDGRYFGCREDVRLYTWLCGLILLLVGVDSFSHWLLMSCGGLECSLHQRLLCYCSVWVFIVRPQKIYFFLFFRFHNFSIASWKNSKHENNLNVPWNSKKLFFRYQIFHCNLFFFCNLSSQKFKILNF